MAAAEDQTDAGWLPFELAPERARHQSEARNMAFWEHSDRIEILLKEITSSSANTVNCDFVSRPAGISVGPLPLVS